MESLGVLVSEESNGGRNGTGDLFAVEKALFLRGSVAVNNEYRALLRLLSDPGADEKVLRSQITKFLLALRLGLRPVYLWAGERGLVGFGAVSVSPSCF